jgi:hypothetical protein
MTTVRNCEFVNGVCNVCGYKTPIVDLHIPCGSSPAVRKAVEQVAKKLRDPRPVKRLFSQRRGPGTELQKLLARWPFRIVASKSCSCNAKARTMDANGCDWCDANIDTIVGWLREEAGKRRLPFLDVAGRLLVKRAIRNARKDAAS